MRTVFTALVLSASFASASLACGGKSAEPGAAIGRYLTKARLTQSQADKVGELRANADTAVKLDAITAYICKD